MRSAQFMGNCWIAQRTRHARQRFEMVGPRTFRCQQQEDEIHRLAIQSLEIDGLFASREDTESLVEFGHFAMRNSNTVANSR